MSKVLGPILVVAFVVSWPFVAVQAAELGADVMSSQVSEVNR